ncbi:hypothetical protein TR13x_06050 [Caloranaerobacter sp. TR13]|uniref:DUF2933 domain-containing protein n=1 Tax=Caloranaerobacter sp. TR13 TaxID=1302151 RepID=UPI0006D41B0C|nr:DUF2933 domain-containing protein [Caloranaerobacter sp. TR13]KPU27302.1 hypothetical protein TR13x_06050 [Caloranaerobacter sp. TR13]
MDKGKHGQVKHLFIMLLSCLIPIGLIILLTNFDRRPNNYYWLVFLLCPLMHVFMMIRMHKNGNEDQSNNQENEKIEDID